jgi:SpoIVB peptidase S55
LSGNPRNAAGSHARWPGLRIGVVVALLAGLMSTAAAGRTDASCTTKPDVYPVDQLHKGLIATGSTVIDGTTQTPFDVKILGVDPDGIAPGIDFILAQITGPSDFLKQTGGIVAGMSGSPVYIGSQLVGSTSYGFFASDQTIMGITPAQPMVDLFDYPDTSASTSALAAARAASAARTVQLSPALRAVAAQAAGKTSTSAFPGTAHQLQVPLAVSGISSRGINKLRTYIKNRLHLSVRVYGVTGSTTSTPSTPLTAGDSLAAGISYGDLTAGAIGTATAVCGDMAVGFGHPFFFNGGTSLGMNGADVLKVIKDPSSIFGGFKFATIGDLHGTIDQDRLTGIRGVEGLMPTLVPTTVHVENLDIPGKHRDGGSQIASQDFVPIAAALTLLNDEDVTFDRIGDGSVDLGWTIHGKAPNGTSFTLRRDDKYYSGYDATIESLFELLYELIFLQENHFGHMTFTSALADSQITQQQQTMSIRQVLVSSSLQPGLAVHTTLKVKPGDTIHVRAVLLPHGSTTPVKVNFSLNVPKTASGDGYLFTRGGQFFNGLFSAPRRSHSFSELVHNLATAEHNYDLVTDLNLFGRSVVPGKAVSRRFHTQVRSAQDEVVEGRRFIRIVVVRPGGGGPAPSPSPKG